MPENPTITITRSRRSSISLHVLPDATIEVKAPFFMPKTFINAFIEKNREWIEKRLKFVQQKRAVPKIYTQGEKFLYLGKEYTLEIGNYTQITREGNKLLFPKALEFRIKKELDTWYIREARKMITAIVNQYAEEMHTSYTHITFSDTRSQWGRCSHDNRLQFSWRLIMAPLFVVNYVVVHELSHTRHKNHSLRFWSLVRAFNPSYRQQIKWLKENGNTVIT